MIDSYLALSFRKNDLVRAMSPFSSKVTVKDAVPSSQRKAVERDPKQPDLRTPSEVHFFCPG